MTIGNGRDDFVLSISEDAYQGDAQFTISVDGKQVGGTQTASASHAEGVIQAFTLWGDWGVGAHQIAVTFLNDAYDGSTTTDRNLYVNNVIYDGVSATPGSATLDGFGPGMAQTATFDVPSASSPPIDTPGLVLTISEDAWKGDALFTISVDGQRVGGVYTATAAHGTGQGQSFAVGGAFSAGTHQVAVDFLNDAWGGTPSADRNLYVNSAKLNGVAVPGASLTLLSSGTQSFSFAVPPSTVNDTGGLSGRGASLLPAGYLSTRGSQIVDSAGNPVRIASVGWDGTDSLTFAPYGLWQSSLQQNITAIKADGFNTIRIPWTDLLLGAFPKCLSGIILSV